MAISQSDYLLQELLKLSEKENDNLSAMRELLIEMNKSNKKSSSNNTPAKNTSRGSSKHDDPKKYSNMFKSMFGNMKGVGNTMLSNSATTSDVTSSIGMSVKGVTGALSKIPGPVGAAASAFDMIVDAGMAVYDYLNAQLNMYNDLNSSGVLLATGITTLERGTASSLMSVNEFSQTLTKNSDVIAAMEGQYGHGVEAFGNLLNSVQQMQAANGLYGVSQQQLADLAAKNFKYQKLYSSQDALRNMDSARSTDMFVKQMVNMSRSVGKSVDELNNKFNSMTDSFDSHTNARSLERIFGQSKDDAAQINQAFNVMASALGEPGQMLQKLNASKNNGAGLPEEYNSWFTQMLTDRMQEIQKAKIKDPAVMQRLMGEFMDKNAKELQEEIDAQTYSNPQLAAFLTSLRDNVNMMNKSQQETSPVMEEFVNRYNTWLADTVTGPFKKLWADTRDSTLKYLMDTYDSVDSFFMMPAQMIKDAKNYLSTGFGGFFGILMNLPSELLDIIAGNTEGVKTAFSNLINDVIEIPGRISEFIWGMITGDGFEKSAEGLKSTVGNLFTHVGDMFDGIKNLDFNYDDMKSRIQSSFDAMKSKIGSWWDTAKSWFSGENPTDINKDSDGKPVKPPMPPTASNGSDVKKDQPTVTEPPKYTKPEKVESQDTQVAMTDNIDPAQETNDAILKSLNNLVSATEQANQTNAANSIFIRQIAENTQAPQNV